MFPDWKTKVCRFLRLFIITRWSFEIPDYQGWKLCIQHGWLFGVKPQRISPKCEFVTSCSRRLVPRDSAVRKWNFRGKIWRWPHFNDEGKKNQNLQKETKQNFKPMEFKRYGNLYGKIMFLLSTMAKVFRFFFGLKPVLALQVLHFRILENCWVIKDYEKVKQFDINRSKQFIVIVLSSDVILST